MTVDLPRSGAVRAVTLNLWGRHGAWEARRPVLVDGLRRLRPDLVAFQEVHTVDGSDTASELLGPDYHLAHQTVGLLGDGNGIAVASRWPLGEVREVDLQVTPRTRDFPCATLLAEIEAPGPVGPLLFVNHLPNWQLAFEYERELQTLAAARAIEDFVGGRDLHVVLAGDLDAEPDAASVRFWSGRQSLGGLSVCYRDAWTSAHPGEPGHTFTPTNPLVTDWDWPFRRIDYVFVRCGLHGGPSLAIAACERIFAKPVDGIWASDHFGVVADLALPPWRGTPM